MHYFRGILLSFVVFSSVAFASEKCIPLRSPVLGLRIEHCQQSHSYRLVDTESQTGLTKNAKKEPKILATGSQQDCEKALLHSLNERYGQGGLNVPLPTLGGKQFWADVFVFSAWRIQQNVLTGHYRLLDDEDKRRAYGRYESCRAVFEKMRVTKKLKARSPHLVLLLHGLFRSKDSFEPMVQALNNANFDAQSINYPSTRGSIAEHADQIEQILQNLSEYQDVSFVTHSLGGIVVRELLSRPASWKKNLKLGRVVMLGPPNQGSLIIESLEDWFPLQLVAGNSAVQLIKKEMANLAAPPCDFAIIAGGQGDKRGYNPLFNGDNDGVVRVQNTHLQGERDFMLIHEAHTFLMTNPKAIKATIHFLQQGRFAPKPSESGPAESDANKQ